MSFAEWAALLGICLAGAASPGPSLAVISSASLRGGKGGGIAAAWAHAAGVALYALLTVLGVAAMLATLPSLLTLLQLGGALYLLYLAAQLVRAGAAAPQADQVARGGVGRAAIDGFSIALLNPKLMLFMLALFSQFLRPAFGASDLALMVATAAIVDGLWYTLVAALLTRGAWLEKFRNNAALMDRLFAAVLALLALTILWRFASGLRG